MDFKKAINSEVSNTEKKPKHINWEPTGEYKFTLTIPPTVYPPREDTDILAKYLLEIGIVDKKRMIEIGCGSGAISILATKLGWDVTACDINPFAVAATIGNAKSNGITKIEVIEGGISPTTSKISANKWYGSGNADLIVWNLPYLEKNQLEIGLLGPLEDAALIDFSAEGEEGLSKNLRNILQNNPNVLKKDGLVFLLHTNNERGEMLQRKWRENGWSTRTIISTQFDDSELLTLFATWKPWSGREIITLETIDSTNKFILNENLNNGALVVTKNQTEGIGRSGNKWDEISESFKGSWLLNTYKEEKHLLQVKSALAVIDSIALLMNENIPSQSNLIPNSFITKKIGIKWPNDIIYRTNKLGGILIQSITKGSSEKYALGIGINCGKIETSNELEYPATSLIEILEKEINVEKYSKILDTCISSLIEQKTMLPINDKNKLQNIWFRLMKESIEKGIYVLSNQILTKAIGITEKSSLIVQEVNGNNILPKEITDIDSYTYKINQ